MSSIRYLVPFLQLCSVKCACYAKGTKAADWDLSVSGAWYSEISCLAQSVIDCFVSGPRQEGNEKDITGWGTSSKKQTLVLLSSYFWECRCLFNRLMETDLLYPGVFRRSSGLWNGLWNQWCSCLAGFFGFFSFVYGGRDPSPSPCSSFGSELYILVRMSTVTCLSSLNSSLLSLNTYSPLILNHCLSCWRRCTVQVGTV